MISISSNLNVMIKAVEKASKFVIRDFGEVEKLQISKKGPRDFVTKTDKRVENIIIEELGKKQKNYSNHQQIKKYFSKTIPISSTMKNKKNILFFSFVRFCSSQGWMEAA